MRMHPGALFTPSTGSNPSDSGANSNAAALSKWVIPRSDSVVRTGAKKKTKKKKRSSESTRRRNSQSQSSSSRSNSSSPDGGETDGWVITTESVEIVQHGASCSSTGQSDMPLAEIRKLPQPDQYSVHYKYKRPSHATIDGETRDVPLGSSVGNAVLTIENSMRSSGGGGDGSHSGEGVVDVSTKKLPQVHVTTAYPLMTLKEDRKRKLAGDVMVYMPGMWKYHLRSTVATRYYDLDAISGDTRVKKFVGTSEGQMNEVSGDQAQCDPFTVVLRISCVDVPEDAVVDLPDTTSTSNATNDDAAAGTNVSSAPALDLAAMFVDPMDADSPAADTIKEADALMKEGKFEEAATTYSVVFQMIDMFCVESHHCLLCRAVCYHQLGQHATALGDCTLAARIKPDHVATWVQKGLVHLALDDIAAAKESAVKVQELTADKSVIPDELLTLL
eukprot:GFYU01009609.1.p1 GENE.GFYU01009609.1~~GFYU01009609.1.p1  ORF type:complete len:446 (-),score=101.77 GFYU01009609.1:88-1425(-)